MSGGGRTWCGATRPAAPAAGGGAAATRAITLDYTGAACPVPLLAARRVLDDLPDGRPVVLISDCPGTAGDLESWCEVTGHELLQSQALGGGRTAYTLLRRGVSCSGRCTVLDQRGRACPWPILAARDRIERLPPGEVLVLLADCPATPSDVAAWTARSAVELVDQFRDPDGHHEFYLRRRRRLTETC